MLEVFPWLQTATLKNNNKHIACFKMLTKRPKLRLQTPQYHFSLYYLFCIKVRKKAI